MRQRIRRAARRTRDALPFESKASLRARVDRLERELDECRRDGRRVAEMLDLLEQRLTPAAEQPGTDAEA